MREAHRQPAENRGRDSDHMHEWVTQLQLSPSPMEAAALVAPQSMWDALQEPLEVKPIVWLEVSFGLPSWMLSMVLCVQYTLDWPLSVVSHSIGLGSRK